MCLNPLLPALQYDQYKTPMENIGLQDSLLSRFDLLFIVLDQMDPEQDRQISDHVLRMHRYRDPREHEGAGTHTYTHTLSPPEGRRTPRIKCIGGFDV